MAKKAVTVDEEALKGMMLGDMPVFGRQQAEEPSEKRPVETEPAAIRSEVKPHGALRFGKRRQEETDGYRERYLVPMPSSMRSQTYISKDIYDRIKRFLPVIAPEVSISGYIGNILAEHLERYAKEINKLYEQQFEKPL